jgi:integrase
VRDLVDRYVAEHLPGKRKKAEELEHLKKGAEYQRADELRMLEEIAKRLGKHTKVADVHGGDIKQMHVGITEDRGPVRANRILAIASKAFSLSLVPMAGENRPWRDAAMGNPCKGVPRNHEEPRGKLFSQQELAAITDALAAYPGVAADCVRLIMVTGCRPSEAMAAMWTEFETETGCWIKPSAHVKSRRKHRVPLSPPAIELIERLRKNRAASPFVFPGQIPGEPLRALWHVWHFVRDRAGLGAEARLYDLRHSFASLGAGSGLSLLVIGKLLGHTQQATTQRYAAHLADDPLREATTRIASVISGAGKGSGNVTAIKR